VARDPVTRVLTLPSRYSVSTAYGVTNQDSGVTNQNNMVTNHVRHLHRCTCLVRSALGWLIAIAIVKDTQDPDLERRMEA